MTDSSTCLAILLVVYQQRIDETYVYQFLNSSNDNFTLIIFDNSTDSLIQQYNQTFKFKSNMFYLTLGSNIGLSRAYSYVSEWIKEKEYIRWIMILDQDTELNPSFIEEAVFVSQSVTPSIYFPNIFTSSGLLSPHRLNRHLALQFKKNSVDDNLLIPINSGTIWHRDLLDSIEFDLNLFLDMIDYDCFFQIIKLKKGNTLNLMNASIKQNFSGESINSKKSDLIRFKIYLKDFSYFCKKWEVSKTYELIVLIKRAIKLTLTHHSLSFIKEFLVN